MARINARPATKLVCEGCGCTDDNACPGGCHWVSLKPPVCSACVSNVGDLSNADGLRDALYGIPEQADLVTADGVPYGADRCPGSPTPALHIPIWTSETEGYCARCRAGFAA
jgi:hypothetical protein